MEKSDAQIHTRLPQDLKERLEKSAKESGRSVNAEVVFRLEESFSGAGVFDSLVKLESASLKRQKELMNTFKEELIDELKRQAEKMMKK